MGNPARAILNNRPRFKILLHLSSRLPKVGGMNPPVNELERTYMTARGPKSYPKLFRELRESVLVFLIPFHPEMDGMFGVGNGDPLPPFVVWTSPKDGERIPLFTSIERAELACKQMGAGDRQYNLCEMNGRELFHLLSFQEFGAVLNPATDFHSMCFDLRAIKKLADGSILQPVEEGPKQTGTVRIVNPADYPTDLLQPLFRFLRERKEVRAAWLFQKVETADPNRPCYVFALKVTGNFEAVQQDFSVVLINAAEGKLDYGIIPVDETNEALVKTTEKFPAFYAAPDYKGPSVLDD